MTDINELFTLAKDRLDIKIVAEFYGLNIDRNGKALCPFHNDKHPSLSFKDHIFKCFSCGKGGDVFTLAGRLLGIDKPFEVLKKLNSDFCLGFNLEKSKLTFEEKQQIIQTKKQRKYIKILENSFDDWIAYAFKTCTTYVKMLRFWQIEFEPKTPKEKVNPLFVEAMQNLSRIEYLCECLTYGNKEEFREFYKSYRKEIDIIAKRIEEFNRATAV